MRIVSEAFLDDLQYSPEYSEYIMENCRGDCPICNGDTLLEAQEDGYLSLIHISEPTRPY